HPAVDVNARSSGEHKAPIEALNFLAPVLSDVVASRPRQLLTQMSAPLYSVRPTFKEKFPPSEVKKIIGSYLNEFLADKTYSPELTAQWTRELADGIKQSIKTQLELPRYKIVVQVVIGEMRGEGVRMGCRCFWDADTDNYADESYRNDSLFCVAAAFGVYLY
ncbi:tctex1 domain-containing protein 2, partial [Chrysochromulina tobinii]